MYTRQTEQAKDKFRSLPLMRECMSMHFTKSTAYLESQQYLANELGKKSNSFDDHVKKLDAKKEKNEDLLSAIKDNNIHIVGIDFSISELRAFRAIQRLFSLTDYKGNLPEQTKLFDGNNPFNFIGYITPLKIKISDYLTAYGVNKNITKSGKSRFNSHEREESLKALNNLSTKMFYFYLTKKQSALSSAGTKKEQTNVIQTISSLFSYYSLEKKSEHVTTRVRHIVLEPTPVMLIGLDNHVMFIPPYEQDIRQASEGKRIPKEVYSLVGYLIYQAEMQRSKKHRNWNTVIIDENALLSKLRLEHYFSKKLRNPKKAYNIIKCGIEYACKSNYVDFFVIEEEGSIKNYTFNLNIEKFHPQKHF